MWPGAAEPSLFRLRYCHNGNTLKWSPGPESNRYGRLCRALHHHSATWTNWRPLLESNQPERSQSPLPNLSAKGLCCFVPVNWSAQQDSNLRPLGPRPSALPDCAMRRGNGSWMIVGTPLVSRPLPIGVAPACAGPAKASSAARRPLVEIPGRLELPYLCVRIAALVQLSYGTNSAIFDSPAIPARAVVARRGTRGCAAKPGRNPGLLLLAPPTGFEPAISDLRGRRPSPLDDGGVWLPGPGSNQHALRRRINSARRLPIPPPGNISWNILSLNLVEPIGIEPITSCLQGRRSPF